MQTRSQMFAELVQQVQPYASSMLENGEPSNHSATLMLATDQAKHMAFKCGLQAAVRDVPGHLIPTLNVLGEVILVRLDRWSEDKLRDDAKREQTCVLLGLALVHAWARAVHGPKHKIDWSEPDIWPPM